MSYTQIYKQVFNSTFSELLDIKDYVINNIQNDKAKEILLSVINNTMLRNDILIF